MNELKAKLTALNPKNKFLLTAGLGILVTILYLLLPQFSFLGLAGATGIQCFTGKSSLLLITSLVMVVLPIVSACLLYTNKSVNPIFAYITTGVYFLFGLILGSTYLSPAFGWWLTLIVAIAWCVICTLLKGEKAEM